MVRLPFPGPGDLLRAADRGYDAVERAIALVPRIGRLIDQIERIAERADAVITDVDRTRRRADQVVEDTEVVVERAGALVAAAEQLITRADGPVQKAGALLDRFQPALTELAPILDQLASTTSPDEVVAVIRLIDTLPELVQRLETEILPILGTFGTVAPDVRDLLDTTREFNEILGSVPGLGRIKKRVEERQEQQDSERA